MSHEAIVCEVRDIKHLNPTKHGIWFETESPGKMLPVVMFLPWELLDMLIKEKEKQ